MTTIASIPNDRTGTLSGTTTIPLIVTDDDKQQPQGIVRSLSTRTSALERAVTKSLSSRQTSPLELASSKTQDLPTSQSSDRNDRNDRPSLEDVQPSVLATNIDNAPIDGDEGAIGESPIGNNEASSTLAASLARPADPPSSSASVGMIADTPAPAPAADDTDEATDSEDSDDTGDDESIATPNPNQLAQATSKADGKGDTFSVSDRNASLPSSARIPANSSDEPFDATGNFVPTSPSPIVQEPIRPPGDTGAIPPVDSISKTPSTASARDDGAVDPTDPSADDDTMPAATIATEADREIVDAAWTRAANARRRTCTSTTFEAGTPPSGDNPDLQSLLGRVRDVADIGPGHCDGAVECPLTEAVMTTLRTKLMPSESTIEAATKPIDTMFTPTVEPGPPLVSFGGGMRNGMRGGGNGGGGGDDAGRSTTERHDRGHRQTPRLPMDPLAFHRDKAMRSVSGGARALDAKDMAKTPSSMMTGMATTAAAFAATLVVSMTSV
jgi:hypothetical protein